MTGAPTFGDAVLRIAPDQIAIPKRLGLYFPDKAAALGRMMAVNGQRTPLTVRKSGPRAELPWTLVVGRHRLGGALLEELATVMAIEVSKADADEIMDIEASENVHRREQPPLERAIFVHAVCEAAKARIAREHGGLSQQQLAIRARWARVKERADNPAQALQDESDDTVGNFAAVYGWQESAANAFGMGKRDVHRSLTLYRLVVEPFGIEITQRLSDHPVVGNNASELANIAEVRDESKRRGLIAALLADRNLSADGARIICGLPVSSKGKPPIDRPYEKFFGQITSAWARIGVGQRRAFVPTLVSMLNTPELKRSMRDRLNEELGDV